jgi:hypothetical protein
MVLGELLGVLALDGGGATRAEHWFQRLANAVPAFTGMSYRTVGDAGQTTRSPS